MSRALCNRILVLSAAIAFLVVLSVYLAGRRSEDAVQAVVEFVAKWALLWTVITLVLGILTEALILITGRRSAD